jgi:hypothetical protein
MAYARFCEQYENLRAGMSEVEHGLIKAARLMLEGDILYHKFRSAPLSLLEL